MYVYYVYVSMFVYIYIYTCIYMFLSCNLAIVCNDPTSIRQLNMPKGPLRALLTVRMDRGLAWVGLKRPQVLSSQDQTHDMRHM